MKGILQKATNKTQAGAIGEFRVLTPQDTLGAAWKPALRLCVTIALLAACTLNAHDSPEHEIEALSKKIAASGAPAELLARRATEWRALGKYDEASQDLQKALLI